MLSVRPALLASLSTELLELVALEWTGTERECTPLSNRLSNRPAPRIELRLGRHSPPPTCPTTGADPRRFDKAALVQTQLTLYCQATPLPETIRAPFESGLGR